MRFENFTKTDNGLLREIIRFCCPSGVTRFDIAFKNCDSYRGRAYAEGCYHHSASSVRKRGFADASTTSTPYVVIGLAKCPSLGKWTKPLRFHQGGGYIGGVVFSHTEAVVLIVAHELRHLWQAKIKRGYRVWGARGQFSERDADAYAIRMTRAWRREH